MRNYKVLIVLSILGSCISKPNYHFTEIKGKQQHVLTWGNGEPVVVFLCGGGSDLGDFRIVQEEIAKITRTVSYDKAGIGKSELTDSPRTLENVSDELNELLIKERINNGPIILVGHSMGGFVARYYLHKYPENIRGIVLIDPGSEYLEEQYRRVSTDKENRIADSTLAAQIKLIPKGFQMEVKAYPKHDSTLRTIPINKEISIILLESNKVVTVSDKKLIEIQKKLYKSFQQQAPQTKIISTSESGHFIQLEEPELVIRAVKELLSKVE